jgi:hypothetical protein
VDICAECLKANLNRAGATRVSGWRADITRRANSGAIHEFFSTRPSVSHE